MRNCDQYGREFLPKSNRLKYCQLVCRWLARQPVDRRRYGAAHRKLRREVGAAVTAGAAACVRCGLAIERDEPWDLDHADGSDLYLGPSHASCNRAQLSLRRRYEDYPEDDPERGIFWGPPCELTGQPRRWSRVWFDWRSA